MQVAADNTFDDGVFQIFSEDHTRMGEMLDEAIDACRREVARDARMAFYRYEDSLRRHIQVEDEKLFVAFGAHTGLRETGPAPAMRREHREIELRLNAIGNALDGEPDLAQVERQLVSLKPLLLEHGRREERVILPACDRFFTERERSACVEALTHADDE